MGEGLAVDLQAMLDTAVVMFQQEWGQKIREQRQAVGNIGRHDIDILAQTLLIMGISLSPEELAQIEEGTFTNIDVRLLLAIQAVLEVGVDNAMFTALKQGAQQHEP